jgi:N-methylhydantoinase B
MATEARDIAAEPTIFDESIYQPPAFQPWRIQSWPRPEADWARIERDKQTLDPITVDVVEGALEAAVAEGEAAVERTSRSTIIREQHDYRAAINTVDCEDVTRVSWAATGDAIRAQFPLEEIAEGDVFLYNDVYASHGTITHLPDYCVVLPIFASGRIIAWATIFGHTQDVGGKTIGSWPVDSRSIFEEGVVIPPVKLFEAGVRRDDIFKIVLRNTRFPEDMRGDIDSFVGACRLMEKRVQELCERLETDVVEAAMYRLIDRCAEAVRKAILPQFPDGEFVGEDFLDSDGINHEQPVKLKVTMRKDSEKILLDWSGTNPQTEGPLNSPSGPRFLSKWVGSFLAQFAPGTVMNEGLTRVFRCHIPPRTVLSSEEPAPVINRMQVWFRTFGTFGSCLAQAFGGQVIADMHCVQVYGFYGVDQDGKVFLYREVFGAGSAARPYADGTDAVDMINDSKNLPAEFIEQRYPVIVESVGLSRDSAGPGQFRGGIGFVKDIRMLVDGHFLTYNDRTAFGCFGVNGGRAGQPGGSVVNPDTPEERRYRFNQDAIPVSAGDIVRVVTPGGGGWGDPLERDPEAVRYDVAVGLVSSESAAGDYGVVLTEETSGLTTVVELDLEATAAERERLRSERGPMTLIDRGPYAEAKRSEELIDYADSPLPGQG